LLPTPTKVTLVAGSGIGRTDLTAFDKALIAAGVGNLNLLRVSSILPPGAKVVDDLDLPPGSLTPVAYGSVVSDQPGMLIAAAVGVGFTRSSIGMIMEYSGYCSREKAEGMVRGMVDEAFAARGLELAEVRSRAIDCQVQDHASVFAAAILWY
jgi:arginine decarboxylase